MTERPTDITGSSVLDESVPFARRHIGPAPRTRPRCSPSSATPRSRTWSTRQSRPRCTATPRSHSTPAAPSTRCSTSCASSPAATRCSTSMIGLGYHGTFTPPVILRNVLENPAWYTAYTPYQPEISQGRLEALLNFQTMVADLTGLPIAGASLLDEATAAAEAMTLARRTSKAAADAVFVVDADALPQTLAVIQTRAEPLGIEVVVADVHADGLPDRDLFGLLLQYPGATGAVRDLVRPRRGGARAGCRGRGRRRPAGADPAAAAGRDRRRHRGRHHPALRRADGLRRTARRLHGGAQGPGAAACPAAWSASPWTPTGTRRTGSPCRPASSTSAARRRRATSARRRCCSP